MRREIYEKLCDELEKLYVTPSGDYGVAETEDDVPEGWERAIKHIDLWNHNVEFIEQESQWERPAVFVEFGEIDWHRFQCSVEYSCRSTFALHVVTDWDVDCGCACFSLLNSIHSLLRGVCSTCFSDVDLVKSLTNHNHEELVENVEVYCYRGFKEV